MVADKARTSRVRSFRSDVEQTQLPLSRGPVTDLTTMVRQPNTAGAMRVTAATISATKMKLSQTPALAICGIVILPDP